MWNLRIIIYEKYGCGKEFINRVYDSVFLIKIRYNFLGVFKNFILSLELIISKM